MATRGLQKGRLQLSEHEGFISYAGFRWLKIALVLCLVCVAAYFLIDTRPGPRGGSWYGYLLGTVGAGLIVWLSLLGWRKRAITAGKWSLKAWTSAHIYLGLSLIVIGTLHTGLSFGCNVHTLAYGLMMVVILSGLYGITAYATLPNQLSQNRGEYTQKQILEILRSIDSQLDAAAQPLPEAEVDIVRDAVERTRIGGNIVERLSGVYSRCGTKRAVERWARVRSPSAATSEPDAIGELLRRRQDTLALARRHIRIRATLEVWLYVHVPVTFALLAALIAHVVSVFFYW